MAAGIFNIHGNSKIGLMLFHGENLSLAAKMAKFSRSNIFQIQVGTFYQNLVAFCNFSFQISRNPEVYLTFHIQI
jgi:Leu/Phe-tRNA-protein transferase